MAVPASPYSLTPRFPSGIAPVLTTGNGGAPVLRAPGWEPTPQPWQLDRPTPRPEPTPEPASVVPLVVAGGGALVLALGLTALVLALR